MGATIAEKILARAAARDRVTPGEYIWATPDLTVAHDRDYPRYRQRMKAVGLHKIAAAAKLVVSIDHRPYSNDAREIETRAWTRNDIKEQGVGTFFDLGRNGISHNITVDHGMVRPGMLVITADTRSPALGCVGALGIANGSGFIVTLYTGKTWLQVPHTIKVTVSGQARPGVLSRDISTHIIGTIGGSKADYRVLEFSGTAMEAMSVEERHTLCNAMVDIGVKGAIVVPDKVTAEYCRRFPYATPDTFVTSDTDAHFESELHFDIGTLEPQISCPPEPENVAPVSKVAGQKIDQAFVGSCMGGKIDDLRAAAAVLRGHKVAQGVRLIVIPATYVAYQQALEEGLMQVFAAAGAQVAIGTCGPCCGLISPLGDGETCISTSTRNDPGRMGSPNSTIYLASAATVAASAVTGTISDPREFLK